MTTVDARLARIEEQIREAREDVSELREQRREDHHRLRNVETSVGTMIDAQKRAREGEARQYRRLATAIQIGSFALALALAALTIVTAITH